MTDTALVGGICVDIRKSISRFVDAYGKELGDISGYDPVAGNIGIIGCGSLGSTIADQIARLGHSDITLWDIDCLEAHNTARHVSVQLNL